MITLDDSLCCRHLRTILHSVQAEVDLRDRPLLGNGARQIPIHDAD